MDAHEPDFRVRISFGDRVEAHFRGLQRVWAKICLIPRRGDLGGSQGPVVLALDARLSWASENMD